MHEKTAIVRIDAVHPQPHIIETAGKIIHSKGVVIFPATCLYGIAADATDHGAVRRVFDLKQRPLDNPILVLIPALSMLDGLVSHIPAAARTLMDAFWPGRLTLVFQARDHISPLITANTGKIGIRLPGHPVARALVRQAGLPITGTSANISGQPGCFQVTDLPDTITRTADLILDAGRLKGGKGSSVIDVTTPEVKMIREGEIPFAAILDALS